MASAGDRLMALEQSLCLSSWGEPQRPEGSPSRTCRRAIAVSMPENIRPRRFKLGRSL